MRTLLLTVALLVAPACAQTTPGHGGSKLLVVMPFENASPASGIDWIGESFPEVLGARLGAPGLYVIPRADRLYAFDRMGIPAASRPSRATLFQIADQMDVDYIVTGKYLFDGTTFTARAQVMDVRRMRLSPEAVEAGALTQLLDIQNALAWDLLRSLNADPSVSKEAFVTSAAPVRLDALENYIRGVIATEPAEKIRYLKQAVKVHPQYAEAHFLLGRTYFDQRDYSAAMQALSKVTPGGAIASEANFYLGLAAHYTGNYDRAEQAFAFAAGRVPLIEVYNNLGVAQSRRGKKTATDYFRRASIADPRDPDYHLNFGISLYRAGDSAGALRQLRETLNLRPQDTEAKAFYDQLAGLATPGSESKAPLERIKSNYDETSYRQLAMEIQNARELRFADMPRPQHAAAHVSRGDDLLTQGLMDEAENEYREAVLLDPTNAAAHIGLAKVLDSRNEIAAARAEATAALQLKATADAYLLVAGLDVKQNRLDAARENVDRAARLEPAHPGIAVMRRAIAARQGEKSASESQP
ncbi:MAG TPA: tetratricopeptide repeat protein [Terriglobales bacterium]|nr:tetratricopeptide repeat protein [Terriglobales bacterium]